jgi:hypothetical protein
VRPFDGNMWETKLLGSARVSRAGDGVLAVADFLRNRLPCSVTLFDLSEVRFGGTPKPTRETRALPNLLN